MLGLFVLFWPPTWEFVWGQGRIVLHCKLTSLEAVLSFAALSLTESNRSYNLNGGDQPHTLRPYTVRNPGVRR